MYIKASNNSIFSYSANNINHCANKLLEHIDTQTNYQHTLTHKQISEHIDTQTNYRNTQTRKQIIRTRWHVLFNFSTQVCAISLTDVKKNYLSFTSILMMSSIWTTLSLSLSHTHKHMLHSTEIAMNKILNKYNCSKWRSTEKFTRYNDPLPPHQGLNSQPVVPNLPAQCARPLDHLCKC